jgi:hypothetical protein
MMTYRKYATNVTKTNVINIFAALTSKKNFDIFDLEIECEKSF